ncbi:4Fe-4S dicluster domain-containing protein [Pontiellaceae bacterium B12219]|nr:4Fe-4S dicluster domain-containing protein [Pontiellaceae bacterium B12219]
MMKNGFFKRHRSVIRWAVRLFIVGLAVFLLIGGPLPEYAARVLPSLSPLSVFSAGLAHRAWYVSLVWTLPSVLIIGLALWKGRFFCRWICPLGTLYSIPSKVSLKHRFFPWRLNGFFFWFIIFAALAGLPLLLFLDPLSTFTRLGALGQGSAHAMAWIPGLLIPLMLLLSLVQPGLWCAQLCPLGYFFEKVKVRKVTPAGKVPAAGKLSRGRRDLLAGLAFGVPLAMLFKHTARAEKLPVLPPGAKNIDDFAATCIRCYACVDVCLTGVLTVRKKGGVAELCIPEMDFDRVDGGFCEQYCNACSQVCPTGAIQSIRLEEKENRKIATASIKREACLAWEERQECMACDEFCAYNAIEHRTGRDGIPKPIVNPKKCRGCGACRNICPAIREGNAVEMEAVAVQTQISKADDESELPRGNGRRRRGAQFR